MKNVETHEDNVEEIVYETFHKANSSYFNKMEKKYALTLTPQCQHSDEQVSECKLRFSSAVKKHYPAFFGALTKISDSFFRDKSAKQLAKSMRILMDAYHVFFNAISKSLLAWLQARFGVGGESIEDFDTFFCIAKRHTSAFFEILSEMSFLVNKSTLYFIDQVAETLVCIALQSSNENEKHYSLFYSCFAGLFASAVDNVKGVYLQQLKQDPIMEVKKIIRQIEALNVTKEAAFHCLLALLIISVVGLFFYGYYKNRHQTVMKERVSFLEACKSSVKTTSDLHGRLKSVDSPFARHRVSLFRGDQTRSGKAIDQIFNRAAFGTMFQSGA